MFQLNEEAIDLRGQILTTTILSSYFLKELIRKRIFTHDEVEAIFAHTATRISLVCESLTFSATEITQIDNDAQTFLNLLYDDLSK
jgi:hypothetical protein